MTLQDFIKACGSMLEASRQMGFSYQNLYRWNNLKILPNKTSLRILKTFGISFDQKK